MKTLVRIDIEAETLDEIDRRAIAANMSRSEYIAFLVEKFPLLVAGLADSLDEWAGWIEEYGQPRHAGPYHELQNLLDSCQITAVKPSGDPST